ncbi:hypothetical protein DN730_13265 [Marinomonas piezotolerans]|uniref:Uncharacterized protein n=1 Tax=Marinomonas piezotolerans TaxID=2213058 RepID=A0A370U7E2_9GAMM|nr:hypothetical protein [Marinomonas piezotolerans]RDL43710.1 hypothetical protein DN730_13265 [Marinomonas piezotolerans]
MANTIGYIKCPERHCNEVAEVRQAAGKRASLYTVCPACGTNQGNGVARQKYLADNLKATREELEIKPKTDTEEKTAIPSKQAASSVSEDTKPKPKADTETIPKGSPTAPPVLLGVLALGAAVITAVFATRKPSKHKEQTA